MKVAASATGRLQTAQDLIAALDLKPHPEGGHYRETFRDAVVGANGRPASTAIYFLLAAGEVSRWHRIDAVEIWHWYGGAPLELSMTPDLGVVAGSGRLGPDVLGGEAPQIVIPTGVWQQARSLGRWTLVGCTVAPGFDFAGFEMAPEDIIPGA